MSHVALIPCSGGEDMGLIRIHRNSSTISFVGDQSVAKAARYFVMKIFVFIDRIRNQFLKKRILIMILNLYLHDQMSGWLRQC